MSYTKQELINSALSKIGISNYNFDIQPEQYQDCLQELDNMMASWLAFDINIGYPIPTTATGSNLNDDSLVSENYIAAITYNLALNICPMFGKNPSMITIKNANTYYKDLIRDTSVINEIQLDRTIYGQGNKSYQNNSIFLDIPTEV